MEGQAEKNTGKVKQYIWKDDKKEFKKKKKTKNAIESTDEDKKKKVDIENSVENTQGCKRNRLDTEAEKDKRNYN